MNKHTSRIFDDVLAAFRANNAGLAWNLVAENIAGRNGMTLPSELLTADVVPRRWRWRHPSAAQAFALTYYGDEMAATGGSDGCCLYELIEDPGLKELNLDELRAVGTLSEPRLPMIV